MSTAADFDRKAADLLEKFEESGEVVEAAVRRWRKNSTLVSVDKQDAPPSTNRTVSTPVSRPAASQARRQSSTGLEIWRPNRYHTISDEDDVTEPNRAWNDT
ncbi:MAG: hypothetical protein R2697_05525 [Ilumatobacteraceae bacterium]